MADFDNKLGSLKDIIYGKTSSTIDEATNKVVSEIINTQAFDTTTIIELLKKSLALNNGKNPDEDEGSLKDTVKFLYQNLKATTVAPESDRISTYRQIDQIYNYNPEIAQAHRVFIDNVLSPDIFTKNTMDIIITRPLLEDQDDIQTMLKYLLFLKDHFKLEKSNPRVIGDMTKYGDSFVEIINVKEELALINLNKPDSLYEAKYTFDEKEHTYEMLLENNTFNDDSIHIEVPVEYIKESYQQQTEGLSVLMEAGDKSNKNDKKEPEIKENDTKPTIDVNKIKVGAKVSEKGKVKKEKDLKKATPVDFIKLKIHKPENVIILHQDDYIIGYIIVEKNQRTKNLLQNTGTTKDEIINQITETILRNAKKLLNLESTKDNPEVYDLIYNLVKYKKQRAGRLKFRFVTPDKMQQFKLEPSQFTPYGESLFYQTLFTGLLLTTLRLSLVIYRLARAPSKRIIYVDSGISRDAANIIQDIKNQIERRQVTVDKLGSIETISSFISAFENIYIPKTKEKRPVEFDVLADEQLTTRIDDVNFILKELLSGLGVPPALLGYEQDIESKATLSQQNIKFARTILFIQKLASEAYTELLLKIIKIVKPDKYVIIKNNFQAVFKPPRSLMLTALSEMADEVQKLVDVFKSLGLPTEKFVTYYLGDFIDPEWRDLAKFKELISKNIGTGKDEDMDEEE